MGVNTFVEHLDTIFATKKKFLGYHKDAIYLFQSKLR